MYLSSDYQYSQYPAEAYEEDRVKYEDEEEQKYEPDNTNGSRQFDDEFEEGEAY